MATAYFLTRAFVSLLGIGALAWGAFLLPLFWEQAPLNRVASELLEGHAFKRQALMDEMRRVGAAERHAFCDPTELHNAMILRLVILNDASATGNQKLIAAAYNLSLDSTRRALYCAPADAFAWLTLCSLDIAKHGFQRDSSNYLRMSYATGPNEGWIALWRSRLAMPLFEQLPADLSEDAIEEFVRLVNTGGLYAQAAAIFASAAPAVQSRIVAQLKSVKAIHRQLFVQALHERGLDIEIPGVDGAAARPWQ